MIEIFNEIAQIVGISANLLMALCWQESHHRNVINHSDNGSKSYGVCQVKLDTARTIIPSITRKDLMYPFINIYIASKYLKKHLDKYDSEYLALSRYNGGLKNGKVVNKKYINSILKYKKERPWKHDVQKRRKGDSETSPQPRTRGRGNVSEVA
jgi:soluble lytic murein transglycosylase-like protein